MSIYFYTLAMWARYCHATTQLAADPNRCVVAELFMRYVCEIDSRADSKEAVGLPRSGMRVLRRNQRCREIATELVTLLRSIGIGRKRVRRITHLALEYVRSAMGTLRPDAGSLDSPRPFEAVVAEKRLVAGGIWGTWARILCEVYELPADLSESAGSVFEDYGLAIQIIDDLEDLPQDMAISQTNLVVSAAEQDPCEFRMLMDHVERSQREYMAESGWVRRYLPKTCSLLLALVGICLQGISREDVERGIYDDIENGLKNMLRSRL